MNVLIIKLLGKSEVSLINMLTSNNNAVYGLRQFKYLTAQYLLPHYRTMLAPLRFVHGQSRMLLTYIKYNIGINKEYDLNKRIPYYNLNNCGFQY